MNRNNYSLEVLVNGRPVQEYQKDSKTFIEGRRGTEYSIRFRNNSHKKLMGIFSVDGLEVLEGVEAAKAEVGYIIDPFSSLDVKGFRIDESSVAAFKFGDTEESYSNTQGYAVKDPVTKETTYEKTTRNNGVIGVRVYEEAAPEPYKQPYASYSSVKFGPGYGPTGVKYSPGSTIDLFHFSGCSPITGCYSPGSWGSTLGMTSGCGIHPINFATGCHYIHTDVNEYGDLHAIDTINLTCSTSYAHGGMVTASASYSASLSPGEMVMKPSALRSAAPSAPPVWDIGTSLGSKVTDKVKEVEFKRSETFVDLEIYYASREALTKYGIDFTNTKQVTAWPKAFEDRKKYCKMPDWYKG